MEIFKKKPKETVIEKVEVEAKKEATIQEQIANTTELEYKAVIYQMLAECLTILRKADEDSKK